MPFADHLQAFRQATDELSAFVQGSGVHEPETEVFAARFSEMAATLPSIADGSTPAGLVGLLVARPHPDLTTGLGSFYAYRKKGKWAAAAKQAGLSKADGDRLNDTASDLYEACCAAWTALLQAVSGQVLTTLIDEARTILARYREHKRASAQLDFDDLIYAARDLLRDLDRFSASGRRSGHLGRFG